MSPFFRPAMAGSAKASWSVSDCLLMKSRGSSSSPNVGFEKRKPSSRTVTVPSSSMTGSQLSLYFVDFTLPSRFRRPLAETTESPFHSSFSTTALPHAISVISSPSFRTLQSSCFRYTSLATKKSFLPTSGFFGWRSPVFFSGFAGPSVSVSLTRPFFSMAQKRGTMGSILCLLMAQILSQDMELVFLEAPMVMTNSFSASTVRPRRRTPRTVGILGSSQPVTMPSSTSFVSFRLESTV
mmetsp:Transcript_8274/g.24581  ORF Transcript_8274/g.24581 Transcript_8274/m.24581 type:complete len:239 (-) Transcript_8274:1112-1828(-)